jgi:hypothetical protein
MKALLSLLPVVILAAASGANAQVTDRGELLYSTHCKGCHSEQMHWRENRRARDWDTLLAEVRRWQAIQDLKWTSEDVDAVARHLNRLIYHFPATERQATVGFAPRQPIHAPSHSH